MRELKNFLIIGGTDRNVGKTTLCCKILEYFSSENNITAIKVSNHFHEVDKESTQVLHSCEDFIIIEEKNNNSKKDTSRYLKSGANNSIFIMSNPEFLEIAFEKLDKIIDLNTSLFIVESAAVKQIIRPSIAILVTDDLELNSVSGYNLVAHMLSWGEFDIKIPEIKVLGKQWDLF